MKPGTDRKAVSLVYRCISCGTYHRFKDLDLRPDETIATIDGCKVIGVRPYCPYCESNDIMVEEVYTSDI